VPAPLDALLEELVATRRTDTLITMATAWLFPGRQAGQSLRQSRMNKRLRAIGVRPRLSRNTALFTLTSEIPAAILAKMRGIHIRVAVQWQRAGGGDWMAYAADVAGRNATAGGEGAEARTPAAT
jgi:hypothetical protein